jgi:hypothetical protein
LKSPKYGFDKESGETTWMPSPKSDKRRGEEIKHFLSIHTSARQVGKSTLAQKL